MGNWTSNSAKRNQEKGNTPLTSGSGDPKGPDLLTYVVENAEKVNAESVLRAIDNCGSRDPKGPGLLTYVVEKAEKGNEVIVALELGTSATRMAYKKENIYEKHAGMSPPQILDGTLKTVFLDVRSFLADKASEFNFIFMNHTRPDGYLEDFNLLKDNDMLGNQTVIAANTKLEFPQHQEYLKHLKTKPQAVEIKEHESMTVATILSMEHLVSSDSGYYTVHGTPCFQ